MRRESHRYRLTWIPFPRLSAPTAALIHYSMVLFLVCIADAIMSYLTPIYIDQKLQNTFWTGIILSTSSMVGFVTDIFLGEWFKGKPFSRFLFWAITCGVAFPVSYALLPPLIPFFILSMGIWGVAYELILFSKYHFINHHLSHREHATGWAVIGGFNDAAYLLGPLLASLLIDISLPVTLMGAIGLYVISFGGYLVFMKFHQDHPVYAHPQTAPRPNLMHELAVWRLLLPKIWPVLVFIIVLTMFDSTMWSVGAILSEEFKQLHPFGGLLFVAYLLPSIFLGVIANRFNGPSGKKRRAFHLGILTGSVYIISGFVTSPFIFIGLIFLASMCSSALWPQIRGVVGDYVERLGEAANLMVSLENSCTSLAYVLGSITAGYVAEYLGPQRTFSVMGCLIVTSALIGLAVMPRKVRLPQHELELISG